MALDEETLSLSSIRLRGFHGGVRYVAGARRADAPAWDARVFLSVGAPLHRTGLSTIIMTAGQRHDENARELALPDVVD